MDNITDTKIKELLNLELKKCHAPVSGYYVACALITEKGTYIEHNYEFENPTVFEHAERRALKLALENETKPKILRIIMQGGGKVNKFKYYIPCYTCTQDLKPYTTKETSVYLLPLKDTTQNLSVNFTEVDLSYQDLPYSKIENNDTNLLLAELSAKTILKGRELDFIADLVMYGKKEDIGFYLTGSATGRGAVSTLIINKTNGSYKDLDLIGIVNEDNLLLTEKKFEFFLIKHYGFFTKEDRSIPAHQNREGVVLKKAFYYCGVDKQLVDFTFSTNFKGSFLYHAYELKNWFHQLS